MAAIIYVDHCSTTELSVTVWSEICTGRLKGDESKYNNMLHYISDWFGLRIWGGSNLQPPGIALFALPLSYRSQYHGQIRDTYFIERREGIWVYISDWFWIRALRVGYSIVYQYWNPTDKVHVDQTYYLPIYRDLHIM